eukprot:TRINITY_DN2187_c0_g1_i6.p1 TRINITY_DN2187_c0_g1~~TRINITY_DN2187_c0_g1_i6.p1  ORF type:complete len:187 (-),score=33.25 TRINITY_DN2187_c0_g1_i6:111-671(-)
MSDSKIFVGKLAKNVEEKDLKKAFEKFGEVKSIEMKHSFAFIEFEGGNAAEDAIKEMNGKELDGSEIRVEKYGENKKEGRTRGPRNEDTCYNCGRKGHWANECRNGDWKNKCYRCGKGGHLQKDCTNSRSASRSRSRSRRRNNRHRDNKRHRRDRSSSRSYSRSNSRSRSRSRSSSSSRSYRKRRD